VLDLLRSHCALASAAIRYWLFVFPRVCIELRRWQGLAHRISDPVVRQIALDALDKRSNMEGAAAFAAVGAWRHRSSAVRALVAFQALYNHADMLAERFAGDSVRDARELHTVLALALDPDGARFDRCSAQAACRCDDDYVAAMLEACRAALRQLPSYAAVAAPARRAAARIVAFQSLSVGADRELERWAEATTPADSDLRWWETAASAGSSLGVNALIASAASPTLDARSIAAIDDAYFPTIGALHSLLDSLVDRDEDAATGQLRLLDCYSSPPDAAAAMADLARSGIAAARALPSGTRHQLLFVAMACSYLSAPEASIGIAVPIARDVRAAIGPLARPILAVFALRRLVGGRRQTSSPIAVAGLTAAPIDVDAPQRGADARVA
jgi:tetraprenyl-beta-curcumene synthase